MAGGVPTRSIEKELWAAGHDVIVGIDEVGRGAWAGPLMVGAAVLPRERRVNGVRDSKMLTEADREFLFDRIAGVVRCLGRRWGIAGGMRRAGHGRGATPGDTPGAGRARVSRPTPRWSTGSGTSSAPHVAHVELRVKADLHCLSVAAASILAKVTRDRIMREQAEHYPHWSFDSNKGYPCPVHKAALQAYGPSAIHRRTWVFMDHYVPWPGVPRRIIAEQPTLF